MVNKNYNFFYPYIKSARRLARARLLIIILIVSVAGGLLVGYLFDFLYLKEMENRLSFLENEISAIEKNPNISKYNETITKFNILNKYNEISSIIDKSINSIDVIDTNLFTNLEMCTPNNVRITSLSLNMYEITMQGNGTTMNEIADFENNLRNNPMFDQIHVSVINRNENNITFSATWIIKDVKVNEVE